MMKKISLYWSLWVGLLTVAIVVLIAFLLATPVAMIFILGGGLLGWIGVILLPQIP